MQCAVRGAYQFSDDWQKDGGRGDVTRYLREDGSQRTEQQS